MLTGDEDAGRIDTCHPLQCRMFFNFINVQLSSKRPMANKPVRPSLGGKDIKI